VKTHLEPSSAEQDVVGPVVPMFVGERVAERLGFGVVRGDALGRVSREAGPATTQFRVCSARTRPSRGRSTNRPWAPISSTGWPGCPSLK